MASAKPGLLSLPEELVVAILSHWSLTPRRDFCNIAASCRELAKLSERAAQTVCKARGITSKGLWCGTRNWRCQLSGRIWRAGHRIRETIGSKSRRSALPLFDKPCALAALGDGQIVVCCAGGNSDQCGSLSLWSKKEGLIRTVRIDGVPCGITRLPACAEFGDRSVAVAVQGMAESGGALVGVSDTRHRVELLEFGNVAIARDRWNDGWDVAHMWPPGHETAGLSFPNGLATYRMQGHHYLACADWNNNRVLLYPALHPVGDPAQWEDRMPSGFVFLPASGERLTFDNSEFPLVTSRPADVVLLEGLADPRGSNEGKPYSEWSALAFVDWAEGCVVVLGIHHGVYGTENSVLWRAREAARLRRGWRSAAKLVQPSGLAWDPVRRSLLVAECGGMCITIYDHCDPSPAGYHAEFKYVTSVCVEQLGTGVVLPTRSEWGWLGITITPEGDVYVADTDQSCLHLV